MLHCSDVLMRSFTWASVTHQSGHAQHRIESHPHQPYGVATPCELQSCTCSAMCRACCMKVYGASRYSCMEKRARSQAS